MSYRQPPPYGQRNNFYDGPQSAPMEPPQEYRENYHQQSSHARPGTAHGEYESQGYGFPTYQDPSYDNRPQQPNEGYRQNYDGYGQYGSQGGAQGWDGYGHDQQQNHSLPHAQGSPPRNQESRANNTGNEFAQGGYPNQPQYSQGNDPNRRPGTAHAQSDPRPVPHRSYSDNQYQEHNAQRSNSKHSQRSDHALRSPTSPKNPSWDNPFPAFPSNHDRKSQEPNVSRPHTGGSQRSHESGRSNRGPPGSRDAQSSRPSMEHNHDRYIGPSASNGSGGPRDAQHPGGYYENQSTSYDGPSPEQWNGIQRSQTMPTEISNNMNNFQLPIRGNTGQEKPDVYPNRSTSDDQFSQEFSAPARAKTFGQEPSYPNSSGYRQPAPTNSHGPQGSYGDVFDSYYDDGSRSHHPHSRSAGEEDMPNFDAVPDHAADKALHLGSSINSNADRGRPERGDSQEDFRGAAHRSRSQPNLRQGQGPNTSNYGQDAPPMPPMNDNRNMSNGYPPNGPPNSRGPPPPNSRMNQRPPPGHFQGPRGGGYGRGRPPGGPGPGPRSGRGPPPNRGPGGPGPQSRGGFNGPAGPPGGRGGPNSHPHARPHNPDALPEHPVPVRPGLMQSSAPPPPPAKSQMPPPVRQYTNNNQPGPPPNNNGPGGPPPPSQQMNNQYTPVTKAEIDSLRQRMQNNPSDQATDLLLAQKLVEAASVLADDGGRADKRTRDKNRERYILDAHQIVKKLVSRGYADAMFFLADCHGTGQLGLPKDSKEAFNLYQSAAKLNHAQAAYRVAVCCEMGQDEGGGTRRDPLKAVQWYKRAVTLGDGPAMYKIGVIQLKGLLGQPANPREAVGWLKRAAERADAETPHALHELGLMYESASGNDSIIRDEAYALELFTKCADLGYKFSQFRLGAAYEFGHLGCPINPRVSIGWYSKAAVQEEHQSELALSGWYLTGSEDIIQQSDAEAYLWARKAAMAGLPKAEYAMGYFTETGIGCPADLEGAKRWYWRAASQNFPKAKERLEDLRKGGQRMQKSRVSRSAVQKNESECTVM